MGGLLDLSKEGELEQTARHRQALLGMIESAYSSRALKNYTPEAQPLIKSLREARKQAPKSARPEKAEGGKSERVYAWIRGS